MLPDALKFVNHPLVLNDLYQHIFYATVFLNFVWWVLTDRTKRNTKKGFVFALWQTSVCTIFTIMFMVTHDEWYSLGAHAAFLSGMLMDFVYGFIYFPEDMYPITTNVHLFFCVKPSMREQTVEYRCHVICSPDRTGPKK